MTQVFGEHIGRTVEAYVDDIVVKSRKASNALERRASSSTPRNVSSEFPEACSWDS
jgi:hypothetical protein